MTNQYADSFNEFGKSAIEATKELVEINSRLMSKMLENQIRVANMFVESSEKQVSSVSTADPKDFVASQTAFFEEYATKLTEVAQANAKLAQEAGEELKTWFEKGVKTADEVVKDAAKTAATVSPIQSVAKKAPAKKAAPKTAASAPKTKKAAPKSAPATAASKTATKKAPAKKAAKKAA